MSLPRQHRLTDKRAFREIFEQPTVASDPCFKIMARFNGESCSRLGLALSRKVDRRAVQRNRLKRLIRESFRQYIASVPLGTNADFIVLPRSQAVSISHEEVFARLARLWQQVSRKSPSPVLRSTV